MRVLFFSVGARAQIGRTASVLRFIDHTQLDIHTHTHTHTHTQLDIHTIRHKHTHTIRHTHTHTHTPGMTPLNKWSPEAATYTTHNKKKRRTSIPSAAFEPAIELIQTYAFDGKATGSGQLYFTVLLSVNIYL